MQSIKQSINQKKWMLSVVAAAVALFSSSQAGSNTFLCVVLSLSYQQYV
jgi:hypothetical protein